jgi:hypothetical protein
VYPKKVKRIKKINIIIFFFLLIPVKKFDFWHFKHNVIWFFEDINILKCCFVTYRSVAEFKNDLCFESEKKYSVDYEIQGVKNTSKNIFK